MIPLSDGIPAHRFPFVNVALIAVNFAVFLFYELPDPDAAISHASFYPSVLRTPAAHPNPGVSRGSRPCSCMLAGITSWAICCFWRLQRPLSVSTTDPAPAWADSEPDWLTDALNAGRSSGYVLLTSPRRRCRAAQS
jgi:hypothetical protein